MSMRMPRATSLLLYFMSFAVRSLKQSAKVLCSVFLSVAHHGTVYTARSIGRVLSPTDTYTEMMEDTHEGG